MTGQRKPLRAAILGGGVIGGGWAARFLLNGHDVALYDPAPDAGDRVAAVLANARRALPGLYDAPMPPEGRLELVDSVEAAVRDVDWVQESVPERLDLKHRVLQAVAEHVPSGAVVGSSTSGFKPSDLQAEAGGNGDSLARQVLVTHPFLPVYLLPLVEIVPSPKTDPVITDRAREVLTDLGMAPLLVRREIDAHIADRLLEAVWREALWLVHDGVATTEEIDEAIRLGFGLRWALMGMFETYRIAGGDAGIRHFLAQFGPALEWPWTKLMDTPPFTPELVETIASQSDAQSGASSIRQLEHRRDDALVAFLRALRAQDHGAGRWLRAHQEQLATTADGIPVRTVSRQIPLDWAPGDGVVPSARVAELFDQATTALAATLGSPDTATGRYRVLETAQRLVDDLTPGVRVSVLTQALGLDGGCLHVFHRLVGADGDADGAAIASAEHLLDFPDPQAVGPLSELVKAHGVLEWPEGLRLAL